MSSTRSAVRKIPRAKEKDEIVSTGRSASPPKRWRSSSRSSAGERSVVSIRLSAALLRARVISRSRAFRPPQGGRRERMTPHRLVVAADQLVRPSNRGRGSPSTPWMEWNISPRSPGRSRGCGRPCRPRHWRCGCRPRGRIRRGGRRGGCRRCPSPCPRARRGPSTCPPRTSR